MKRKTKIAILVSTLILSVALLNVGFAAWVLSNSTVGFHEGNISVEAVDDEKVTLELDESVDAIHFGKPASISGKKWLSPEKDTKDENLEVVITMHVSKNIRDINVYFQTRKGGAEDKENTNFKSAIDKGLIGMPKYYVSDDKANRDAGSQYFKVEESGNYAFVLKRQNYDIPEDDDPTANKQVATVYITISFSWGEHFGNVNPYEYYGDKEFSEPIEGGYSHTGSPEEGNVRIVTEPGQAPEANEDAFSSLYLLNDLLSDVSYVYTFKSKSDK